MVSLFQTVPTCILTDHQHGIWRLAFLLSLSLTTLSIYDLGLFNLENNLFEAGVPPPHSPQSLLLQGSTQTVEHREVLASGLRSPFPPLLPVHPAPLPL